MDQLMEATWYTRTNTEKCESAEQTASRTARRRERSADVKQYSIRAQFPRKKNVSLQIRERILNRDDYTCFYCGFEATQVDHIVPWSYGGGDDDDNLVACCDICNAVAWNFVFDTLDAKKAYVRAKYGPYLAERVRRVRRKLSICSDCQEVFAPCVAGASAVLCGACYRHAFYKPKPRKRRKAS